MTDETRIGDHLGTGETSPAEHRARADQRLREIEEHGLVPAWCWRPMTETLATLASLPDEFAWVAPAYLSTVARRGERMFDRGAEQLALDPRPVPTLPCRCGTDAPADPLQRRKGRYVQTATCPNCGLTVAAFDEALYERPTLLAPGLVY